MSMYIYLFTVAIPANYTHEFRERFEAATHIRSYHPSWRLFLHPQPEDVPRCDDKDPPITGDCNRQGKITSSLKKKKTVEVPL